MGRELERIWDLAPAAAVALTAMLLSAVLVRHSIGWLCRHGFAAEMGARHIHKRVIPTAGGIGMIGAFLIAILLYQAGCVLTGWGRPLNLLFLVPMLILLPLGLYDDRWGMRPRYKLAGQLAAGLTAWLCGFRLEFGFWAMPDVLSCLVTLFWMLLFINAFNLIDGLDGLAAGLAVLSAGSLTALLLLEGRLDFIVLPLVLMGVCLGFLRYNFHPARVFMGDTGSMFLGYMLAGIGLAASNRGTSFFAILAPILACGVPLIDTMLAVWRRATFKILSKRSWREIMSADRSHLHHRILEVKQSDQSRTAVTIYILGAIFGLVGLVVGLIGDMLPALAALLVAMTLVLVLRKFAVLEMWNSTLLVFRGLAMPRRSVFINVLHPAYDLLVIVFALTLSVALYAPTTWRAGAEQVVVAALVLTLLLTATRTYQVFWLRAGTLDHVRLFLHITFGFLLLAGLYGVAGSILQKTCWSVRSLWPAYLATVVGILGERILLIWLQILLPRYYRDSEFSRDSVPTLLYGAGGMLPAYLRYAATHWDSCGARVIGLVDNEKALHGQYVCGCRILGGLDQLEEIYRRCPFARIVVITERPLRSNMEILERFCAAHGTALKFFTVIEAERPLDVREDAERKDGSAAPSPGRGGKRSASRRK